MDKRRKNKWLPDIGYITKTLMSKAPPFFQLGCSPTQGQGTCPDNWKLVTDGRICAPVSDINVGHSPADFSLKPPIDWGQMTQDDLLEYLPTMDITWYNTAQLRVGETAPSCFGFCQTDTDCLPGETCVSGTNTCHPNSMAQCSSDVGQGNCPDGWMYYDDDEDHCIRPPFFNSGTGVDSGVTFPGWTVQQKQHWANQYSTRWFNNDTNMQRLETAPSCRWYCTSDKECPNGYYCGNNVCTMQPGFCVVDSNCPAGKFSCVQSVCTPSKGHCLQDSDCPNDGYYCNSTYDCTPIPGYCTTVADCSDPKMFTCEKNHCTPIQGACSKDTDCNAGFQCVNNQCQQIPNYCSPTVPCPDLSWQECGPNSQCQPKSGMCGSNSDCTIAQHCDVSTHQCIDFLCGSCPPGTVCDKTSGKCVVDTTCKTSADCPNGIPCVSGVCTKCTSDTMCPSGQKCDLSSGKCSSPACSPACAPNQTCVNGSCQTIKCSATTPCPQGLVCNLASGICEISGCKTDADCADSTTGKTHCDKTTGECVSQSWLKQHMTLVIAIGLILLVVIILVILNVRKNKQKMLEIQRQQQEKRQQAWATRQGPPQ